MSDQVKHHMGWLPDGYGGGVHTPVVKSSDYDALSARHLDLLGDVLEAKEFMRASGVGQDDFASMFKRFVEQRAQSADNSCPACKGSGGGIDMGDCALIACMCNGTGKLPAAQDVIAPRDALANFIEYSVPGPYDCDEKWFADKKALVAALAAQQSGKKPKP